ncbi:hypothetical protein N7532_006662 [Penicillium argentinense]|uniref:Putative gamma-glutamylcyclotransferase n=1 Tax=Penicillium argentinense TaxID=1131581 RepID=A0A9W9KBH8_9EURO|nr:uncharacterized protein N7532_006662 [Penicillium argentinense]KAJ5099661.1 hypothetical protein N7532_006662 [Penicillium argentinense]
MGDHALFFYGTLMAPQILHRVIHGRTDPEPWQKGLLRFRPAILHGYRRHRVRHAEYPGIVPAKPSNAPSGGSAPISTSVLGTLVSGLTDGDIYRLDLFEGEEYSKEQVTVRTLREGDNGQGKLQDILSSAGEDSDGKGEEVVAVTYVFTLGEEHLEEEWDFETFKRDKLARWIGADERQWQSM